MEDGYRDRRLPAATDCARALRLGRRHAGVRELPRLVSLLPGLILYLCRVPGIRVRLSESESGAFIAEHLALRRCGVPRFRIAQGVLPVPSEFSTYLRGRRRQAVRTNNRRALESGMTCGYVKVASWTPEDRPIGTSPEAEHWTAIDPHGGTVAEAWLVVDEDCALLHTLTSSASNARWLLHTAIVERLCAARCQLLITNSYDIPLMPRGHQHFQHLLGYTIARIQPATAAPPAARRAHAHATTHILGAVSAVVATAVVVGALNPSTFGL